MRRHLIITVHGIRTFGQWQERLEMLLRSEVPPDTELTVVNYKFGYFSALAFLSVVLRWLTMKRFRSDLRVLARMPWDCIDIVAHSFGTFIATKALGGLSPLDKFHVHTLILAGSVLPDSFRWNKLIPSRVENVLNECGTQDNILVMSQLLPFLGMAGRGGFRGFTGNHLRNRFFQFGHSGYFLDKNGPTNEFMRTYWVPVLIGDKEPMIVDMRKATVLAGLIAFLLNNSRPIKIFAYAVALLLIISQGLPRARSAYAEQLVSRERGYVARDREHRIRVWFDKDAEPTTSIRWLSAVGPVDQLDLDSTKLHDRDVQALQRDESLSVLALGGTQITEQSLPILSRFPSLRRLSLADDPLKGLEGLPNLSSLEELDLTGTGLRDSDLVHLSRLRSLRRLDLSDNEIEGVGLRQLSSLTNLTELVLDDDKSLADTALGNLTVLGNLQKLSLSGSGIEGGLSNLTGLRNLWSLNLSFTDIDDLELSKLPVLPRLRELMMTGVNITGSGFTSVGMQPALQELWLKDTQVSNDGLLRLSALEKLRILALPGTKIKSGALANLRSLKNLDTVYLGGVDITDQDLNDLTQLPRLKILYLPQNPQIGDRGLRILRSILNLRELNIERTGMSKKAIEEFRKARPEVKLDL